ncbi:RibD C-terminal domain containing protein [Lotmaria passim]
MSSPPPVTAAIQMASSLDGKITGDFFRVPQAQTYALECYRIDNEYFKPKSQVCMCGRKTMRTFSDLESPENYPATDRKGDRSDFHADVETNPAPAGNHYYAWVDPHGRLGWKVNTRYNERFPYYNGDRIVEVLVEDFVTDEFLAQLRKVNVPYIFAGKSALDCRLALDKLGKLFKTNMVVCHGGGTIAGTLLEQGLVSQISLVLVPSVCGDPDAVSLFAPMPGKKLPMTEFDLEHVEKLGAGCLWLRYSRKA